MHQHFKQHLHLQTFNIKSRPYRGCSVTLPPPQSESSFLDTCPGVGKFICEKNFLGRVELREEKSN